MFLDESSLIENLVALKESPYKVRKVGTAADLAAVKIDTRVVDSLFVLGMSENKKSPGAPRNSCDSAVNIERFGIVYAVSHTASKRDDFMNNSRLKEFRTLVRSRFKALVPTGNSTPLIWQTGRMMSYNDTTLWFQDEFITEYRDI